MAELFFEAFMETTERGAIPKTDPKPEDTGVGSAQTLSKEDVEKIVAARVQSETDRVRTELYGKIKAKDEEIVKLKQSTMTEAEIRKEKEKALADKERDLKEKELKILATDSLRDSDLPVDFRDFVIGEDEDKTKARVLILKREFQKAVEAAVADKFKSTGHEPAKGEPAKPSRQFTPAEIAKMTPEEFAKHEPEIMKALQTGTIKR